MSGLRLVVLGTGDAFSARYYSSSLALEADGVWLLIDCAHPIRKVLCEASAAAGLLLTAEDLAGVALTHLHADHCSGLEGLGYYNHFVMGRRLDLLVHPMVSARLWEHLAPGMDQLMPGRDEASLLRNLEDFFQLHPLSETTATRFGPFTVECRRTIHSVPTTAFRIQAAGRSLGYSADTAYDPDLIDWLAAADLIIHETNHGIHTPYERLAALPAELRQRMRLIHYPDDFVRENRAIEALYQGQVLAV